MAGRGRAPKARGIAAVRELTPTDVAKLDSGERGKLPVVARFRDSHHKVARLIASGMRPAEVALACGYTIQRIYTLSQDPSFKELVESYRGDEDEAHRGSRDDFYELLYSNKMKAERRIADKLDDDDTEISIRELHLISRDAADRTGYGKRSVNFNVNADFAGQMEAALRRTNKVIEGTAMATVEHAPQRQTEVVVVPSPALRRV